MGKKKVFRLRVTFATLAASAPAKSVGHKTHDRSTKIGAPSSLREKIKSLRFRLIQVRKSPRGFIYEKEWQREREKKIHRRRRRQNIKEKFLFDLVLFFLLRT